MTIFTTINAEARIIWSLTPDATKAAIRTAYQTVQAAVAITLFALASAAVSWASGADVNLLDVVATGRAAVGAAALTAIASLRAYYMNRGDRGAIYG
jgi:formylmethanofuran dehydrogenase subunit E-like metal-binding protein